MWDSKYREQVRLDDDRTDIDTWDAFEYSIDRDLKSIPTIKTVKGGI